MPKVTKNIPEYTLDELAAVSKEIISLGENFNIWVFSGEMGTGKTTLIKEICKEFGVDDNVHSPTYSLVNEYEGLDGEIFYHFDFYRLKNEIEAMDIGVDEYFYSGNICFIEWAEKIPSILPEKYLKIAISLTDKNKRSIFLSIHDSKI